MAPDLRDGRPPEKAEPEITAPGTAFVLRVACRPGGPAPLPSGFTINVTTDNEFFCLMSFSFEGVYGFYIGLPL